VTTAEAARDGAIAGLGLTRLLSYQVAEARRAGTLELVLEAHELTPWPVSLVYPGQQMIPVKLRAFIDYAAPYLREALGAEIAMFEST
jgi:DNA-binding transcriptional LysR family regulator